MSAPPRDPIRVTLEFDPEEMARRGRLGAAVLHSKYDGRQLTAASRAVFLARFEAEVDPDGVLPPEERAKRAEHARRAYFAGLALKSAKARRSRKAAA